MLSILDSSHSHRCSRREWLRIGGTSLAGLSLARHAASQPSVVPAGLTDAGSAFGRARSVIVIFLNGGPPQHETFDPKPNAPAEIRGGFGAIPSQTPGMFVGELMPRTALLTDRIAVLRAMVTNDNAHSSSGYQMMTGVPHVPLNVENAVSKAPNLAPHWGSKTKYLRQLRKAEFPPSINVPCRIANTGEIVWPGQIGGVLGPQYDPWLLTCDPASPTFAVPDLALPPELPSLRFHHRLSLLEQLGSHLDRLSNSSAVDSFDRQTKQALGLLNGAHAKKAFDISLESEATRDRYGRTRWGQSVLLSRRLIEAGVSFVQVNWATIEGEPNGGGWDTHNNHNDMLKRYLMPWMDRAYSALLSDLEDRGLLQETLVVWAGEFGHTPRFNGTAGRDHWGQCFSIALAGGGIRGGVVHGKSDDQAAYPVSGRVEPSDLHATMFHLLGHPPETQMIDTEGRPLPISRGRVIEEIV